MGDNIITPKYTSDPKLSATIHVTCDHGKKFCHELERELENELAPYNAFFMESTDDMQIRSDEGTIVELRDVPQEAFAGISERIADIRCVRRVRALLH